MSQKRSSASKKKVFTTKWFSLIAKTRKSGDLPHYYLETADYVTVLALTNKDQVLLVRQYRPACELRTLELPSGHVDGAETPLQAMKRELLEETGYKAGKMILLGALHPDTGRHSNKLWCFLATDCKMDALGRRGGEEVGLQTVIYPREKFLKLVRQGKMDYALNLAVLFMAQLRGKWQW